MRTAAYHATIFTVLLSTLGAVTSDVAPSESTNTASRPTASTNTVTTTISSTSTVTSPSLDTSLPPLPVISTCEARTVNYITHTLPQQCLKSSWSTPTSTVTGSGTESSAAEEGASASTESRSSEKHESQVADHSTAAAAEKQPSDIGAISTETPTTSSEAPSSAPAGTASPTDSASTASTESETETDSPLDNANFLSFEDWKKQNLEKSGQSPEHVRQGRNPAGEGRRRPLNIDALDSLGEDAEIELDFSGFGAADRTAQSLPIRSEGVRAPNGDSPDNAADDPSAALGPRSKDAGKTCKERFNYASFDCAATVLKTNQECKSSSSVLVENKDSYMLNECAAQNKFLIVELCEDILVDTLVLANFEFFSSMFRTFRVSVSDRYPVKLDRWKVLGEYEARNTREIQAFLIEQPQIWARYLRVEFLTHYGNEFYCPISLLRVHGTTMMEEFKHEEESVKARLNDAEEVVEDVTKNPVQAEAPMPQQQEPATAAESASMPTTSEAKVHAENDAVDIPSTESSNLTSSTCADADPIHEGPREQSRPLQQENGDPTVSMGSTAERNVSTASSLANNTTDRGSATDSQGGMNSTQTESSFTRTSKSNDTHISSGTGNDTVSVASHTSAGSHAIPSADASSTISAGKSQQGTDGSKLASTALPPTPSPTTQESFFKSVHKRLQMLESNASLSLQYIEDQSRILRDAFTKVERRQLGMTERFLGHLNMTVMADLREFRQQYDQLWQSTVIALDSQQEQSRRDYLAMSTRLTLLADELVWQKRMQVVQTTLLLLCLGFVFLVRSGFGLSDLDNFPLMQQMVHRSRSVMHLTGLESPGDLGSPFSTSPSRASSRKRWTWRGTGSDDEVQIEEQQHDNKSSSSPSAGLEISNEHAPTVEFQPPSPMVDEQGENTAPDPVPDEGSVIREIRSEPSTPTGTRDVKWADGIEDGQSAKPPSDALEPPNSSDEADDSGEEGLVMSPVRLQHKLNDILPLVEEGAAESATEERTE